jgi:hypothetical protein
MRSRTAGRVLLFPVTGLALTLAACSSSGGTSTTSTPPAATTAATPAATSAGTSSSAPAASGTEPTTGAAAQAAITSNWKAFFSGKTSASQKLALLENGQTFSAIVTNPQMLALGQNATATVKSVAVSGTTATVVYSISIGGPLGLPDTKGTAVYQGGVWKVGDASFCQLMTLENGGTAMGACKGVG